MFDFIISALTNMFRIYMIFRLAEVFHGKTNASKLRIFGIGITYYITNMSLFWIFHTAWINLTCNLVGTFALLCLFTKSVKANFFSTCSITIINILCDAFVSGMFFTYEDGKTYSQIYEILTDCCILICLYIIRFLISKYNHAEQRFCFSLASVPLCTIGIIMYLLYSKAYQGTAIVITSIGLLIINFFMFHLYNQLLGSIKQEMENEILEQKIQIYSNQLNIIVGSEEKARALRHDMKHHLNELTILAKKTDSSEILSYLEHMNDFFKNPEKIVSSGNVEIDSVLNYMLQKAKKELTDVKVKVVLPDDLIHSFDINVLLCNLLENAIDAAMKTERKYLGVFIEYGKGIVISRIENSFMNEYLKKDSSRKTLFLTTKTDKANHGIGLKNVRKIVESHNGEMEINTYGDVFYVCVLLYISEP